MKRTGKISILIVAGVLSVVAGVVYYLQWNTHKVTQSYNPQTKSDKATSNGNQAGGITDNNTPQPSVAANKSIPPAPMIAKASPSSILVSSPGANELLSGGSIISGTSPSTTVNYRIIDISAGMLANGQLNVSSDHRFSGSVQNLKPKAKTGYIEFFYADATGVESNNIKVAVTF